MYTALRDHCVDWNISDLTGRKNALGLTVPCTTVPSCFARSSFDSMAILHISASTGCVLVRLANGEWERWRKRTEDLVGLAKPKREAVERHELAIRFRSFLAHLGRTKREFGQIWSCCVRLSSTRDPTRPCQAPKGALSILRLRASIGVLYGTYASFPSMPTLRVFVPNK